VLDCHLMVEHPQEWVEPFAKAGASTFTFHLEAVGRVHVGPNGRAETRAAQVEHAARVLADVRARGMRAGVALRPGTPVDGLVELCRRGLVDLALCMTVEPGFGGQKFMGEAACAERRARDDRAASHDASTVEMAAAGGQRGSKGAGFDGDARATGEPLSSAPLDKVRALRRRFPDLDIQVDGGVGPGDSVREAAAAGANVFVAGTSVFCAGGMGGPDMGEAIAALRAAEVGDGA